jgi:glycosyltransferase involved in cell wall biosynthesis
MRICIEAQRLFRPHKHGMEIVALETIRALQALDTQNEYHIIAANDSDTQALQATTNFTIHRLKPSLYPKWEQITLPGFVKKLQPDLLHCTANTAPLFYKGNLLVTIHDLIFMDKTDRAGSAYQRFGNRYRRWIVPAVARKATAIATVSEYSKQEICKRLRINENKVTVVHNGVSSDFMPIEDAATREAFRKKYAVPTAYLLHIGNTAPRKNTLNVCKAYHLYRHQQPDALPLVISGCSEDFIREMLQQIGLQHLREHIHLTGYIEAEDLPLLYGMSSLFLYPSLQEGFGLPVIEAMSCGVPVITSNGSSLKEIAGQAAKLVNPESPEEIAAAIRLVLNDEAMRKYMQSMGIMNARRFSWRAAAEQTLALYQSLQRF